MTIINESGLYSLILSSKLIEAQVQNDLQNTTCFLRLTSMVRDCTDRNNEVC
jgi:prophage antirepressor-like protein